MKWRGDTLPGAEQEELDRMNRINSMAEPSKGLCLAFSHPVYPVYPVTQFRF